MVTAKAFGMKVTQYFVGFGPTIWSFRRGETEYGLKAHPARRLLQDRRDDAAGRRRRAGRRAAGDVALPGLEADGRDVRRLDHPLRRSRSSRSGSPPSSSACPTRTARAPTRRPAGAGGDRSSPTAWSPDERRSRACTPGDPASPAAQAGLQRRRPDHRGQRHAGRQLRRPARRDPARAQAGRRPRRSRTSATGSRGTTSTVDLAAGRSVRRWTTRRAPADAGRRARRRARPPTTPTRVTYGPVDGLRRHRRLHRRRWPSAPSQALQRLPQKVPALWTAITGGERDPDTPISVVGASRLGGEAVEQRRLAAVPACSSSR